MQNSSFSAAIALCGILAQRVPKPDRIAVASKRVWPPLDLFLPALLRDFRQVPRQIAAHANGPLKSHLHQRAAVKAVASQRLLGLTLRGSGPAGNNQDRQSLRHTAGGSLRTGVGFAQDPPCEWQDSRVGLRNGGLLG